jgi:hypothetical protein
MIESVKIENFRCFSELEVHGLRPINILVGENASGKSAFLEAVFLLSGAAPQVALQLRAWRQFGAQFEVKPDADSYWSLWDDLFFQFDLSKTIRIEIGGSPDSSRSLSIYRKNDSEQTLPFGRHTVPAPAFPLVRFDLTRHGFETVGVTARVKGSGLVFEGDSADYLCPIEFLGPYIIENPKKNAENFSTLSTNGRLQPVVDAMRGEFPFLKGLSLEIYSGAPAVFAEVEGKSRKFPVGLISDGVNKLITILLCIATKPNGTILIDQIEDGFYFKRMPSIWRAIHRFAKENNTQIFATTHSKECLDALLPVLEANEEDFALLRANRSDNSIGFSVNNGRRFSSALSQEFELR